MRTFVLRAACVLALSVAAAGCSALGLADLPQSDCVNGPADFCDSLAMTNPTGSDCGTWQCNHATRHCEILPRDDDGDDAPSMMCAPSGTTPDCDDTLATGANNYPGNTESCDGRDEDCDGIVDDGVITTMMTGSATLSGSDDRAAVQPDADESYVLVRGGSTSFERALVGADGVAATATMQLTGPTGVLAITTQAATVAGIGSNTYAFLAQQQPMAGCRQWVLAPITASSPNPTLRTTDASLLPDCPAVGSSPQVTAPSVSGRTGAPLLVGWLEADMTTPRNCGSAEPGQVVIGTGQFDSRGNRIGAETLRLGESVDLGPIASVPTTAAAGTGAFLVAFPTADSAIVVHRITITALFDMTDEGVVYTEPAGAMRRQGVGLALGPTVGASTTIALSFYEGCGGSNAISVRWLTVSGSTLTPAGITTGIGTGLARSLVQVVHQPRSNDWLVGWRSSTGLSVQRVFDDGALEGDPIDVVSSGVLSSYAIQARTSGALFQATTVTGSTNVQVLAFGCAAE